MIYVKDRIQCDEIHWSNCGELECIGLNIILSPQMSFTLIVIYRPPSSNISFYEKFESAVQQIEWDDLLLGIDHEEVKYSQKNREHYLKI